MKLDFISGGINAEAYALDVFGETGAYASGPNIFTFNPKDGIRRVTPLPESCVGGHVHCVQIVEDAEMRQHILACGTAKKIKAWAKRKDEVDWQVAFEIAHEYELLLVKALPNLKYISAVDITGTVLIYDQSGKLLQKISCAPRKVHSIAWANEDLFAIGTSDKTIKLYSANGDGQWKLSGQLPGHTNWATCLDWSLPLDASGTMYLASSGPDKTARIWKLAESTAIPDGSLMELIEKKTDFMINGKSWSVKCDAILYGHEGGVNSCRWAVNNGKLALVTSSTDHTIIIWAHDTHMWMSQAHLGDISGTGSLGSDRSFGFYSGIILDDELLVSHGSKGSIEFWRKMDGRWVAEEPLTGHTASVQNCCWDRGGRFLLTTSLDQTTRAFAPSNGTWYEIARPQIHGYDLQCIAAVDGQSFMSGADEKVLRFFKAPDTFLKRLCCLAASDPEEKARLQEDAQHKPVFVPALGLSNKDITDYQYDGGDAGKPVQAEMPLGRAPTEGDLCRHTLWPEIDKLYGHGYELYSLAVSPCGKIAASASKANLSADGAIRLWRREGERWLAGRVIPGHSLTIVSLSFSPDGTRLLATSRDRSWSVTDVASGQMVQRCEGHSRIIWTGTWLNDETFITGARDGKLRVWRWNGSTSYESVQCLDFESSITASAYNHGHLAIGHESGKICIHMINDDALIQEMPIGCVEPSSGQAPSMQLNCLSWSPTDITKLAAVSADRSLRIYTF